MRAHGEQRTKVGDVFTPQGMMFSPVGSMRIICMWRITDIEEDATLRNAPGSSHVKPQPTTVGLLLRFIKSDWYFTEVSYMWDWECLDRVFMTSSCPPSLHPWGRRRGGAYRGLEVDA